MTVDSLVLVLLFCVICPERREKLKESEILGCLIGKPRKEVPSGFFAHTAPTIVSSGCI